MSKCEACNSDHDGSFGSGRFCSRSCANIRTQTKEANEKRSKTLTKLETIVTRCKYCSGEFETIIHNRVSKKQQEFCSRSCGALSRWQDSDYKKKMSVLAKERGFGGHTSKVKILYETIDGKQIYLQSSYEILVAKDLDENSIEWIRPDPIMWYDDEGVDHKYYPDFYLKDYDIYLDPKNDYLIKQDKKKIDSVSEQNDVIVLMLSKDQLSWKEIHKLI